MLIENFKLAKKAGTPLIAINSFDPEATIQQLQSNLLTEDIPIVQWDIIRGFQSRNDKGKEAIAEAMRGDELAYSKHPQDALVYAANMPQNTVIFFVNAGLHIKPDKVKAEIVQAIYNLRDPFKFNGRIACLMGLSLSLPLELQQDVFVIDEKLPDDAQLRQIIVDITTENGIPTTESDLEKAIDALRGLAAFPAEQAVAMSASRSGLDISKLWERKRQLINDTPGLSVWKGGQKFEDLGGLDSIKERFRRILGGKKAPRVVVWIDEIEKAMGGSNASQGDSSGTSQDQLGVLLSEMQDKEYSGTMLVGVPGAAKSAFAKSVANEAEIITIKLDLGEMKGQFVGLSEERIRHAMKIIEAVGGPGGAFFIATSNDIRCVKPELKRRFKKGIWFFDTPTLAERQKIWEIHLRKAFGDAWADYMSELPEDAGWTGAEIESCVQTAWEEGISLKESAKTIIPVTISGAAEVERLRNEANGRYSSVVFDGPYKLIDHKEESRSASKNDHDQLKAKRPRKISV